MVVSIDFAWNRLIGQSRTMSNMLGKGKYQVSITNAHCFEFGAFKKSISLSNSDSQNIVVYFA